ncbi:hypothetical protein niasHT_014795 [Heterodera trifolii]|uniref:Uncharacterized protein n=1 Tax=Heterodera trifolii TaxID=157864 RepID=A0ABD2L6I7_9BILA
MRLEEMNMKGTAPPGFQESIEKRGQIAPTMPTTKSSMSIDHVRDWYRKALGRASTTGQPSVTVTTARPILSSTTMTTTERVQSTTTTPRVTKNTKGASIRTTTEEINREVLLRQSESTTPRRRWTVRAQATTERPLQPVVTSTTQTRTSQSSTLATKSIKELSSLLVRTQWIVFVENSDADKSPFCKPPPGLTSQWKKLRVSLYIPYRRPQTVSSAFRCAIKRTKEYFYTNLLGDQFVRTEREFLPVQRRICVAMIEQHKCPYEEKPMKPIEGGGWSSNNPMNAEFPGRISSFVSGEKEVVTMNCFVEKATLFYRPHNFKIISPLYSHLEDCNYLTGSCNMADNTTLVWKSDCKESCQPCDYHFVESIEGEFTGSTEWAGGTWISKSREQALTFNKEAKLETACNGKAIRMPDQSFGILEQEYLSILTAGQLATSRSIAQLFSKECRRSSRGANPTLQARRLLRRKDVMARWLNEDTMQIFSCAEFSMQNVEYQAVNNCYRYIPLSQNNWIKIDTRSATVQKIDPSSISEIQEASEDPSLLEITPLVFHRWTIDNDTGEGLFAHLDEWLRLDQWKSRETEHKNERATNLGALPSGLIGLTEEWFMEKLRLLLSYWTTACCIYVTFLFVRDVLIPLTWVYLTGPIVATARNLLMGYEVSRRPRATTGTRRTAQIEQEMIELAPNPMPQELCANEPATSQQEPVPTPLAMQLKRQLVAYRSRRQRSCGASVATEQQPQLSVERTERGEMDE